MIKEFSAIAHRVPSKSCEAKDSCIVYRDSLIKRFEFCYDLTWKFLKHYLYENHAIEVASPKKVFQECIQQNLITPEKAPILMEIVEARNLTSHTYQEEIAHEIAQKIPEYYKVLSKLILSLPNS